MSARGSLRTLRLQLFLFLLLQMLLLTIATATCEPFEAHADTVLRSGRALMLRCNASATARFDVTVDNRWGSTLSLIAASGSVACSQAFDTPPTFVAGVWGSSVTPLALSFVAPAHDDVACVFIRCDVGATPTHRKKRRGKGRALGCRTRVHMVRGAASIHPVRRRTDDDDSDDGGEEGATTGV